MSFFHKVKKAVVGTKQEAGSVSLCPDYDAVKVEFDSLHAVMLRIRQHLLTYREANSRLWTSATSLSDDFADMLEPSVSVDDHPYSAMAASLKKSHSSLPTERERLDTMLNACLFPLKEQLGKYEELKVRMTEHDKQKDEVVYYQGKVSSLRTTREASKKAESAADREKWERNVKKMNEQEANFHSMDSVLTAELRYAFEHRVAVLGPIMLAFVLAEKQMAASYTQAINGVKLVDVTEANAWLAKHEAAMAAKVVTVQTITSTKTIVTDSSSPTAAITTSSVERKASTAPNVAAGANPAVVVSSLTTSGIVVSEPHFANGSAASSTNGTLTTSQLQSPTGQSSASFFDSFDADFGNSSADFGTNGSVSSTSSSSAPFSDPFASTSSTSSTSATHDSDTYSNTAAVDGVPYTIGSASSHYASSLAASHPATSTTAANGTTSSFPIEQSLLDSTPVSGVTTPAVMMDDMALEKTRGAEQLDAAHGTAAPLHSSTTTATTATTSHHVPTHVVDTHVDKHVEALFDDIAPLGVGSSSGVAGHHVEKHVEALKHEKADLEDGTTFGVGEKTDMFGVPAATTTATTTTGTSHVV